MNTNSFITRVRDDMIKRGLDLSVIDAFTEMFEKGTPPRHFARSTVITGGMIHGVSGEEIRALIDKGFKPCVQLEQTRFADSVVHVTHMPVGLKTREKMKFEDDQGNQYECLTEPKNFICTLFCNPMDTYIRERKTGQKKPKDGEVEDRVGTKIEKGNTVLYAYQMSILFGTVLDYTAGKQVKVKRWGATRPDYVKPASLMVVDSHMSKNVMKLKLQR